MRPPEVLDYQSALIDYLGSRHYATYLDSSLGDMVRKGKLSFGSSGAAVCQTLQSSLKMAQAVHVQAEMMPLLRAAAMDLEDDDYLAHSNLPAEHGWTVFETPWQFQDVWGKEVSIAAFQWRHGTVQVGHTRIPAVWLACYTDINDPDDETTRQMIAEVGIDTLRQFGRFHLNHLAVMRYGEPVGPTEFVTDEQYQQWATGGWTPAGSAPNLNRMVVGLFRLLTQVIVEVADAPIDRPTVRRMTRKNLPARVQTVKLRRKHKIRLDEETVGEGHVEWQHQWAVRGHWAWRACGESHPSAEEYEKGYRARVYIAPYLKGPEGKPILLTEKVWGLSR